MGYDGTLKFDTSIDTSGFQSGIKSLSSIASGALKTTATIIAGTTTAIAGIGAAAIKVGSDFESQMSRVQAISGATGKEFEALKALAVQLGADTAFSAQEAAEGMENLASAGFSTSEIMDAMPGMLDLAASSGEDLANSSDIAASTLRGFGLEASKAGHVADVLAKNAADTNAAVADTGEAMKYIAPVAHSMGISFEECSAAIGIMADAGIKGSQAGTTLRGALSRLAKPTDAMLEVMDDLGLSFYDSEGKMKSLTEMTAMLQDKMSGLTDEQKQQALITLFGQESLSGMLALMDRGSGELGKLTESYMNCDGAAEQMAKTMQNNLSSQIEQLQGAFESLGISIYEDIKEPLTETTKALNGMADELLTAFNQDGFSGLVSKFGDCLAELAQMAVDAAPQLVDAAVQLVHSFIESIMNNSDEFSSAGAELVVSLANAILNVTGEIWSAGITLFRKFLEGLAGNASEIGASASEMVLQIVGALQENVPLIIQAGKDFVNGFLQGIEEDFPGVAVFFEGFFEGFSETASAITGELVDIVSELFDTMNEADPAELESVGKAIGTIAASISALQIANTVIGSVKSLFSILGTFKSGIGGVVGVIGKIVEGFALWKGGAGTLMEVLSLEFPKIAGVFTNIGTAISKVAGFISTFGTTIAGIGTFIGGAITAVTSFFDMLKNGFSWLKEILMVVGTALAAVGAVILGAPALVAGVVAGIVAAVGTLIVVIKDNWSAIVEFFQSLPEKFGQVIETIVRFFQSLPEKISSVISSIVQFFTELPGKIVAGISSLGEKFIAWGASFLETATTVVSGIISNIVNFFSQLPYKIGYAIGFVIGTLIQWGLNIINWVTTTVPQIIDNIVNFFAELPGKIWTWLTNTFNNLVTWGSQMLQKAGEVASSCIESIVNFFSQLPGRIWTLLTNAFNNLVTWGSNTISKAKEIGSNTINAIINFFSQLPGKIWTWLTNTVSKVVQWGRDLVSKGKQAASDLVNAVINGVKNLPSQMADIGYNIVTGVWEGICNAADWFRSQVENFFSGIVDGVKGALDINSPSGVFESEVGEWILPGVGKGIKKSFPSLLKTTDEEMKMLANKMNAAIQGYTGKLSLFKNAESTIRAEVAGINEGTEKVNGEEIPVQLINVFEVDGKEMERKTVKAVIKKVSSTQYAVRRSKGGNG